MTEIELVLRVDAYIGHLVNALRCCRRVREILVNQPIPSYFGRLVDPNHPRTLTPADIRALWAEFRKLRIHVQALESLAPAVEETILSTAAIVRRGEIVPVGPQFAGSYVAAAALVVNSEAQAVPPDAEIGFLDTHGEHMDELLSYLRLGPWAGHIEFSPAGENTVPVRDGPDRVQAFAGDYARLAQGLEAERAVILAHLNCGSNELQISEPLGAGPAPDGEPNRAARGTQGEVPTDDYWARIFGAFSELLAETRDIPTRTAVFRRAGISRSRFYRLCADDARIAALFNTDVSDDQAGALRPGSRTDHGADGVVVDEPPDFE
jgi:hypothetical protein